MARIGFVSVSLDMEVITSTKNDTVKLVRSLALKKHRRRPGLSSPKAAKCLPAPRRRAGNRTPSCCAKAATRRIFATWGIAAVSAAGQPVCDESRQRTGKRRADCIGIVPATLARGIPHVQTDALWLALENIRDPGNLGTIIRTADAVSAAGHHPHRPSCDPYGRDCVRATMGSIFALPLLKLTEPKVTALLKSWPGEIGRHCRRRAQKITAAAIVRRRFARHGQRRRRPLSRR